MPVRGMKLLVIAAKAIQMMLLEHKTARYSSNSRPKRCLMHDTVRYSRKSRSNDVSET